MIQKRKQNNSPSLSGDRLFSRLDEVKDIMLSSTNDKSNCSVEDNISKTVTNLLMLQKASSRAEKNWKQEKIIENCTDVLLHRSNFFRETEYNLRKKETRKKRQRVNKSRSIIDDTNSSSSDDFDDMDGDFDDEIQKKN